MNLDHVEKFCGLCKHPYPGHYASCPIVTQLAQKGALDHFAGMAQQGAGGQMTGYGQAQAQQPGNVTDTDWAILTRLKEVTGLLSEIRDIVRVILEKQP